MQLKDIIWIDKFVSKLEQKHNVSVEEVEEALFQIMAIKEREYYHVT